MNGVTANENVLNVGAGGDANGHTFAPRSTSTAADQVSSGKSVNALEVPSSGKSGTSGPAASASESDFHFYPLDIRSTYHPPASFLSYKSKQVIRQAQEPRYATAPRISHFLYEV